MSDKFATSINPDRFLTLEEAFTVLGKTSHRIDLINILYRDMQYRDLVPHHIYTSVRIQELEDLKANLLRQQELAHEYIQSYLYHKEPTNENPLCETVPVKEGGL